MEQVISHKAHFRPPFLRSQLPKQAESAAAAQEAKQQTGLDEADVTEAEEETAESGADNAITYRHPDDPDKTWSGKGRTPKWIQEWEQQGGDREALRA